MPERLTVLAAARMLSDQIELVPTATERSVFSTQKAGATLREPNHEDA
jgi:hypothetical protein